MRKISLLALGASLFPFSGAMALALVPTLACAQSWRKANPNTLYQNQGFGQPGYFAGVDTSGNLQPPSSSVRGGVMAGTAPSNQFQNGISTAGAPQFAQPSFGNLAGTAAPAQLPITTPTTLGAIKAGTGITVAGDGTASVVYGTGAGQAVQGNQIGVASGVVGTDSSNNAVVGGCVKLTSGATNPTVCSASDGTITMTTGTTSLTLSPTTGLMGQQ